MSYRVLLTAQAKEDLLRLFDFVIERELTREGGDLGLAQQAVDAIHNEPRLLEHSPFACCKAGFGPFLRELVIPFGHTGCVALFDIADQLTVRVAAIRHQREDDYH